MPVKQVSVRSSNAMCASPPKRILTGTKSISCLSNISRSALLQKSTTSKLNWKSRCGADHARAVMTARKMAIPGGTMHGKPRGYVLSILLGLLLCAAVPAAPFAQQSTTPTPAEVDMQWAVKIPMRDAVSLNATVFRLHAQTDRVPVIFTFTPYIGDSYLDRAMYFARHGYVYALVDVRGRGNSGGTFAPFENDAKDGYDIVEWFAKQPYCNGKLAMWGG